MVGTKDLAKRRLMFVSRAQAYVKLVFIQFLNNRIESDG